MVASVATRPRVLPQKEHAEHVMAEHESDGWDTVSQAMKKLRCRR